ncbi:hypothetical protein [Anatilimnocola floriformis]|uniref:hypothetical protein n=1 Tax=Anatilimnocola floriformis TaxID=2948575 RepID=UPI0020C2FC0B|nr:hypothetical protein [Anatilimnocola floriformis]
MPAVRPRGPWFHRFLVWFFTIVLVVLTYWTLSFLLDDIGEFAPPDYQTIRLKHVPAEVNLEITNLTSRQTTLERKARRLREQQSLLREGTENYQRTMRQMAELESLRLQKGEKPTEEQTAAVAQAEQQFLKNQREYQQKTEELALLAEQEEVVRVELEPVQRRLAAAETAAQNAYAAAFEMWQWQTAAVKVGMLVPLMVIAGWLFRRFRNSVYAPLVYAFGIAVGGKVLVTVHAYFPEIYFKYLIIGTSLALTIWLLAKLLRMIARPQTAWLLKQYREAYESFLCPVCDFPIRRGPMKFLSWTKNTIKRLPLPNMTVTNEPETAYTCPMCATQLYEECGHCHGIRTSLLPACSHCGDTRPVGESPANA